MYQLIAYGNGTKKKKKDYISILAHFRHMERRETTMYLKYSKFFAVFIHEQSQPLSSNDEAGDQLPGILIFNQPIFEAWNSHPRKVISSLMGVGLSNGKYVQENNFKYCSVITLAIWRVKCLFIWNLHNYFSNKILINRSNRNVSFVALYWTIMTQLSSYFSYF